MSTAPRGEPARTPGAPEEPFFSLRSEWLGTTLRLRLAGEFDWAVTGHVECALEQVRDLPLERLVFDLSELTFIDLPGLRVILAADERGQAGGYDVRVVRPRGLANRIFTLTRAGETLDMADRPPSAPGRLRHGRRDAC